MRPLMILLGLLALAGCTTPPQIDNLGTLTRVEVRTLTGSVVTTTINLDRPGAVVVQGDGAIAVQVGR
jgi:uncharacterized lipoprotein YajG